MVKEDSTAGQACVIDKSKAENIKIVKATIGPMGLHSLLVKFCAVPINSLDLAVLDGMYPVKPFHSIENECIPGYDGVAEVIQVGEGISDVQPGDFVIPSRHGLGTWRTYGTVERDHVTKIEKPTDVSFAAILKGSVIPAYLLLDKMATLHPGDWIVQNAGTSVIAYFVAQFARIRGIHTVSVVRDRPAEDLRAVRDALHSCGADLVLTESDFADKREMGPIAPVLGIDSVFGTQGKAILDSLDVGGTYVQLAFLGGANTYMDIGAKTLWARGLTMKGFRAASQLEKMSVADRRCLFEQVVQLFNAGELCMPSGILGLRRVEWVHDDADETERRLEAGLKAARGTGVGDLVKHILIINQ